MKKMDGFLVAMDIGKAFDLLDHDFLILTLEKYGFGNNFILWIRILLRDLESCVINGGKTTKYFSLGRGACQSDPILAFLFILALEILFILIKSKPGIAGITIFDYNYLYSAYTDDTTFFLKDIISLKHMVDTFHFFWYFSGLKPNLTKSEISGIGVLKGVQVAVCGMRCTDLNIDTLKILSTHFSFNDKLKEEKNFYKIVTDMQRVLKIWKMRKLTLERKIVIFKTIAISRIVFQAFITVPKHIVSELKKMQKAFFWNNSSPKIKHESLCNDYKAGGLKNIDIPNKIIALQCSWITLFINGS